MKKIYSFFLFSLFAFALNAQNYQWVKNTGGESSEVGRSQCTDQSGNIYVIGDFKSDTIHFPGFDIGNTTSFFPNYSDVFIIKYDPTGNVIWAKSFGGAKDESGLSITIDNSDRLYISGSFNSDTLILGNDTLLNTNPGTGYSDVFIARLSASGNFIWTKCGAGDNGSDEAKAVATDTAGNVYVGGSFGSWTLAFDNDTLINPMGGSSIFILKLDSLGTVIYAINDGEGALLASFAADPSGNIFMTGRFGNTATFGGSGLSASGYGNMFLAKYDPNGNMLWVKGSGQTEYTLSSSLTTDISGNVYVTGYFNGATLILDNDTLQGSGSWLIYKFFIAKFDGTTGAELWAKAEGLNSHGKAVASDNAGNVYVTGYFGYGSITLGTITMNNTIGGSSFTDLFVVKYDSIGNVIWAKSAGGTDYDEGNSILTKNDNVYIAGDFKSSEMWINGDTLINPDGSGMSSNFLEIKMDADVSKVWPGDADHNSIVDNTDLLQIGLFYSQTGAARSTISNVWQANMASDWGTVESNGADIKHADCNGDGVINNNDTLAINQNFSLMHAISTGEQDVRTVSPEIYFVTGSPTYNPGDWVDAELWLGTAALPVSNLYGIAFNIQYNASLVQPGSESITYPISWLGYPATTAIKISKINSAANIAYGGETRITHTNASGYGKIANFKFQLKNTISSSDSINLSIVNYSAVNATGAALSFTPMPTTVMIPLSIKDIEDANGINIYPNPFTQKTTINYILSERSDVRIDVYNLVGQQLKTVMNTSQAADQYSFDFSAEDEDYEEGIYFIKICINGRSNTQKVVYIK